MSSTERWCVLLIVVLVLALMLGLVSKMPAMAVPASELGAAAVHQPVTVALLAGEAITATGQSTAYNVSYYREGVGYLSTTVTSGAITYTWQTSPDRVTWFTHGAMASVGGSGTMTYPLSHFGPALRLGYEVGTGTVVTASAWVSLKE